jgi:acylphosphatase
MADTTVRANILVTGRVQGVFFRSSAMQEAQRLGLTGFVQNLPDGSVEAVVEAPEAAVEQFIAWCKVGPPSARIDDVQVRMTPPRGEFRTFSIIR